jgi:hypothetical protein
MALGRIGRAGLLLAASVMSCWLTQAAAGGPNNRRNSLPAGEIKFRFSGYANNVKVLPPLVAEYQLGVSRITGNGVIKDGKVTGSLTDTDALKRGTRSLKARIVGGSYSEVGPARRLSLTVEITESSHPTDEAAPGVTGTLELQDSPARLKNGKPDDSVGLGGWNGAVRTHIHGWNNEDPGQRTWPTKGGPPNGGLWADVEIGAGARDISGTWNSDWGPVTLRVHQGRVTGSWAQGRGRVGKITGGSWNPQTGTLTFTYSQDWNKQKGSTTLRLSPDGRRLTGTWKQTSGNGTWSMTR